MVDVVLSTYRIMTKQVKEINGKYETEITADSCYCFARSEHFGGCSGRVWGSEFMHLRYEESHKFEISKEYSKEFKSICIILKDSLNYYIDSLEKSDVLNVNKGDDFMNI